MSTYGQPPSYGRADYDGRDPYESYADSYAVGAGSDSYGNDPYPADPYAAPPPRPSASGRAAAGRARVSAAAAVPASPAAPAAEGPEGSSHRYDWSHAGSQRPAGRASVPVSPAGGAAGRASVRPGGTGPKGPGGTGPGNGTKRKKKRHWLRNSLLCVLAVMVITVGGSMVALSYYVDSVVPPEQTPLPEGSTVYYADGREMAVLQDVNREIIDTTVPELENARNAVVATEDKDFFEHSGVDFMGIIRAAWNNFTGGPRQGASTIDQQYAGAVAGTRNDDSYSRKLREAAMAYKMNQEHDKLEILDYYLNTIYFGRGAHGIQAAAEAYFGKDAAELTLAEAAVLAGCIRLPDDGSGLCPYDPLHTPDDLSAAQARFDYVLNQLVAMGKLDPAERDQMELPEVIEPRDPDEPLKGPQGNIVRQVQRELKEKWGITDISTGGYRITTTIDRDMQKAARDAARRKNKGAHWEGIPKNVEAALVAIDPATGAVLAYYGGDDGVGFDLAGRTFNEATGQWEGGREPGSTMKVYALVAALRAGVSMQSHWKTTPYTPPWRDTPIRNAGRGPASNCGPDGEAPDYCTLRWSTVQSYNVPFIHFSEALGPEGPAMVLQAAMDAGIRSIIDSDGVLHDLTEIEDASELAPSHFFHELAIGQYGITVLDHASGIATLAADGVYHEPHFVAKVEQKVNGEWVQTHGDQVKGEQRIEPTYAQAITGVLSEVPTSGMMGQNYLADGRPAAAKTGTWEHTGPEGGNKDAWVVGYTRQIATAVWVGARDGSPIKDQGGRAISSSGLPAVIWKQFMDAAHAAKEYPIEPFPPAPQPGDPNSPLANGERPEPEEDEDDRRCPGGRLNPFCDDDDDGGGEDRPDRGNVGVVPGGPIPPPPDQDPGG